MHLLEIKIFVYTQVYRTFMRLTVIAERYNRTIMDRVRCLCREANLDREYWPEIVKNHAL